MTNAEPGCRLYAVVEAAQAARERLSAALSAADIAAVLIVAADGDRLDGEQARLLVALAQRANAAALVAGDAALARALGADGVHLAPHSDAAGAYEAARSLLGPRAIVGIDVGISRDAAMSVADAGADYVAFGAPAHLKDRDKARARRDDLVAWWAEIFQVPCVAFDVEAPEVAASLARAGADFIAVRLGDEPPATVGDRIAAIADAVREPEAA